MPCASRILLGTRLLLAAAIVTVLVACLSTMPDTPGPDGIDKIEHFTAFFVVALLAACAFPKSPIWLVGALVSAYGGLIEILQGLTVIGRDRDFIDWLADTLGVACALLPMWAGAWRAVLRRVG